jgi:RimJ/RimL family protein N-acetyltransferase
VIATRTLYGRLVRLAPYSLAYLDAELRWNADAEVRHFLHRSEDPPALLTREKLTRRIQEIVADPSELRFAIETLDGTPIGNVGLLGIHPHGRAELSIMIGEKAYWSRGYGGDAIRCLLGLSFGELGLRRVTLIADADNVRGIRCYERCGFRHEGVLRAHRLRYGKPLDMVTMGILREELDPV